ncbi:repressor LexA [candidate division WWE3 bacterium RIFOXYD1_FULL_39_9]|uniref:Repressor LexA n=1 Tax=candidate division WWE3 bacterium RIFOXYD1_FULL_39_9 TaxID=1802649 RepID=A0A1F4X9B7_UNCKA|nr:MAG: repressor LexA [candidate division WWE3 bacterium RIFOXYD1_FULL_39_9]
MEYKALTTNQRKVLEAVLVKSDNNGFSPISIREIQSVTGLRSVRGVTLQLEALEKNGLIFRNHGKSGIRVNTALLQPTEKVSIPLMTSVIPAGYGSPADNYTDQTIEVSLSDTKGIESAFAVKVSGESMIGAGIEDGDIAVIAPQQIANDGDIVAALYEDGVTLKRYRIVDDIPMLTPANPKYEPITKEFSIQGKLVNILKSES